MKVLKDEYAGKLVECPQCGAVNKASESTLTPKSQADEVFNRDIFLLRQKHLSINQKYQVSDEQGNPIFDSPVSNACAHYLHNMLYVLGPTRETSAMPARVQAELTRDPELRKLASGKTVSSLSSRYAERRSPLSFRKTARNTASDEA